MKEIWKQIILMIMIIYGDKMESNLIIHIRLELKEIIKIRIMIIEKR